MKYVCLVAGLAMAAVDFRDFLRRGHRVDLVLAGCWTGWAAFMVTAP